MATIKVSADSSFIALLARKNSCNVNLVYLFDHYIIMFFYTMVYLENTKLKVCEIPLDIAFQNSVVY